MPLKPRHLRPDFRGDLFLQQPPVAEFLSELSDIGELTGVPTGPRLEALQSYNDAVSQIVRDRWNTVRFQILPAATVGTTRVIDSSGKDVGIVGSDELDIRDGFIIIPAMPTEFVIRARSLPVEGDRKDKNEGNFVGSKPLNVSLTFQLDDSLGYLSSLWDTSYFNLRFLEAFSTSWRPLGSSWRIGENGDSDYGSPIETILYFLYASVGKAGFRIKTDQPDKSSKSKDKWDKDTDTDGEKARGPEATQQVVMHLQVGRGFSLVGYVIGVEVECKMWASTRAITKAEITVEFEEVEQSLLNRQILFTYIMDKDGGFHRVTEEEVLETAEKIAKEKREAAQAAADARNEAKAAEDERQRKLKTPVSWTDRVSVTNDDVRRHNIVEWGRFQRAYESYERVPSQENLKALDAAQREWDAAVQQRRFAP